MNTQNVTLPEYATFRQCFREAIVRGIIDISGQIPRKTVSMYKISVSLDCFAALDPYLT